MQRKCADGSLSQVRISIAIPAMIAAAVTAAAPAAYGQAMDLADPREDFGPTSYYDVYPKRDPENLTPLEQWTTCWAFSKAEKARLEAAAESAPEEMEDELDLAAAHYQVAVIYYGELVRGNAIYEGKSTSEVNDALTIEEQSLIGAGEQWLAENAAQCIVRLPDREMPEFADLYPWLADALGTDYRR